MKSLGSINLWGQIFIHDKSVTMKDPTPHLHVELDSLVRRTPYTAVKRISKVTAGGKGKILWATKMEELYPEKNNSQEYIDSVGQSLNKGVNELADILHTFYLNVVAE